MNPFLMSFFDAVVSTFASLGAAVVYFAFINQNAAVVPVWRLIGLKHFGSQARRLVRWILAPVVNRALNQVKHQAENIRGLFTSAGRQFLSVRLFF